MINEVNERGTIIMPNGRLKSILDLLLSLYPLLTQGSSVGHHCLPDSHQHPIRGRLLLPRFGRFDHRSHLSRRLHPQVLHRVLPVRPAHQEEEGKSRPQPENMQALPQEQVRLLYRRHHQHTYKLDDSELRAVLDKLHASAYIRRSAASAALLPRCEVTPG
jgi:hypothetical protein